MLSVSDRVGIIRIRHQPAPALAGQRQQDGQKPFGRAMDGRVHGSAESKRFSPRNAALAASARREAVDSVGMAVEVGADYTDPAEGKGELRRPEERPRKAAFPTVRRAEKEEPTGEAALKSERTTPPVPR